MRADVLSDCLVDTFIVITLSYQAGPTVFLVNRNLLDLSREAMRIFDITEAATDSFGVKTLVN